MVRLFITSRVSVLTKRLAILDPLAFVKTRTQAVRHLPYVLVPNMDTSSRSFHKALNTIAKQAAATSKTKVDRLFTLQQGTQTSALLGWSLP